MDEDISIGLSNLSRILDGKKRPGKLKLSVLSHITENFCDERKIGEGGCGHVYKGILPSGQIVAVKKLLNAKTMDDRMFQQEVTSMMRVKHQNIVRFLGYCSHIEERAMKLQGTYILVEERERLLCFEYMSNGSLADYVSDELRGLEWHTRFEIIKGICKGLHHLHNEKGIIHMDLKPLNILLDDNLVPKIADFGISRAGEISKTISQERVCSLGYCAPEYLFDGKISFKSDIHSFGVIITEIVTGNREEPNNAVIDRRWRHRWKKTANNTTFIHQQQVTKCLELAQSCKNQKPTERPNIEDIIRALNKMENIGRHTIDATGSTVEQKNSFLVDMLEIEPLELHFSAELNKQVSHLIKLTNYADDYVAFRVSTTSRLPFHMVPNEDVIPPRSSCCVTISLEALKKRLWEGHCKAELCVKSTRMDKDLTSQDIMVDIFKEEPDKLVDMVNLTVMVGAPKHLLVVEPLELRYWPIEQERWLPCLLQLTSRTCDYVAFTFILPRGNKVLYNLALQTGVMAPWSTRGVVIDIYVVEKEIVLADMQYKETCLLRSMVVQKGLEDDDVSVDMFYEQTCVQELELSIVFSAPRQEHQAPSLVYPPMYNDELDWEDDDQELMGNRAALISPFSIETELLLIYPAALRFASHEEEEYISLTNKTDQAVVYAISDDRWRDYTVGVVPPQSTCAVLVQYCFLKKPYLGVMMISGSRRYHTGDSLRFEYDTRDELMNQVRAEGGNAHEAVLACTIRVPQPIDHEVTILRIQNCELYDLTCMDVHPMEPWVVAGLGDGRIQIHKMDPKTSAYETMMSAPNSMISSAVSAVKFIARMQWVACGHFNGYISVYSYADDRLTEMKNFLAEEGTVHALTVHPTLPYLLSSCKCNLIKIWDWNLGWVCTREYLSSSTDRFFTRIMTFNPKDANSFATLNDDGEINIWSMNYSEGPSIMLRGDTIGIAYCYTGSDLQCMARVGWQKGKIEILDLRTITTHVHALEATGFLGRSGARSMACHPTRPVLAIAKFDTGIFLWKYTTYGLTKIPKLKCPFDIKGFGFMDVDGFQRLVIATYDRIEIVDILDGDRLSV